MLKQLLENLKTTIILPATAIADLERHLADNYPNIATVDYDKVVQQYLEKQIEAQLEQFDDQYRPYIRRQLFHNIMAKHTNEVSELDILKACLELNFDIDNFYRNLKKWLLSLPINRGFETELASLVALLRQVVKDYPKMTLEELIETEQLYLDAASQIVDENPPDDPWREKDFGNLVPVEQVYFDSDSWDKATEANLPVFQKGIVFTTLAVASLGLVLLSSISFLMAASNHPTPLNRQVQVDQATQSFQTVQADQPSPNLSVVKPKTNPSPLPIKNNKFDNRIKLDSIANRSTQRRKSVGLTDIKSTSNVVALLPVRTPTKAPTKMTVKLPAHTVIVGYTQAYNGDTITKIPLVKNFSSKVKLKASFATPNSETGAAETIGNGNAVTTGVAVIKGRTIKVDPKIIPAGSQVYIKHSPEYRNLDGVYTVEASDAADQAKGGLEESVSEDNTVVNSNRSAAEEHEVEVYVLDEK
jgi:3D (Asp-Asp-Asp) domain-containing protein